MPGGGRRAREHRTPPSRSEDKVQKPAVGKGLESIRTILNTTNGCASEPKVVPLFSEPKKGIRFVAEKAEDGGDTGNSFELDGSKSSVGERPTNKPDEKSYGLCVACDTVVKSPFASWTVPEVFLDEKGKVRRDEKGDLIDVVKDPSGSTVMIKGYTCSSSCEKKKESEGTYLGKGIKARRVTCFNGPIFYPKTDK